MLVEARVSSTYLSCREEVFSETWRGPRRKIGTKGEPVTYRLIHKSYI